METNIIHVMRAVLWEKAKGYLHAILQTYISEMDKFKRMNFLLEQFIKEVEDNGLTE